MIYTVTFNPAVDYVVKLDRLTAGCINRTLSENICWGGKGINVSAVLKMLGIESTALGFTAGFTGLAFSDAVEKMGIKTDFIHLSEGMTRINMKIHASDSGKETEINGSGPDIPGYAIDELIKKLNRLSDGDYLVLAGSVPKSVSSDIYEMICKKLENSGVRIAADASGDLLKRLIAYKPFVIKPNHIEAGEMLGIVIDSFDSAQACALHMRIMGARNVIISMAGDGSVLADEAGNVHCMSAPKGEVVNSTGAGDSMLAGFIAGYSATGDFAQALEWGTAAGSATAFSLGTADRAAFDEMLGKVRSMRER